MLRLNATAFRTLNKAIAIQIQPMLRLNIGKLLRFQKKDKNSNTTNVKVKLERGIRMIITTKEFKYNQC